MPKTTPISILEQRPGRLTPPEIRALAGARGRAGPARSLYLHVPFCAHKCHYCDFYSIVDTRDRQEAFTHRLIRELRAWSPAAAGAPLASIFIGGGTPSLLRIDLWRILLDALHDAYDLSDIAAGAPEFTVECNPESVTPALLDTLAAGGVSRISMGAQTFHDHHLRTLERRHRPEAVAPALDAARAAGIPRSSIDLIYAVPGQTLPQWDNDLDAALALGTEHLSCYNLTYEPGTAMTARLQRQEFVPADEDTEIVMFEHAAARLDAAGLRRYEVSNHARPGAECRHNLAYWRQEQWIACGPSASAHLTLADGPHRWKNTPRLDDYLDGDDAGFAPAIDHEPPDPRRALVERIMTGLRLAEGLDPGDILRRAAAIDSCVPDRLAAGVEHARSHGHIDPDPARWALTPSGVLVCNAVARSLARALG